MQRERERERVCPSSSPHIFINQTTSFFERTESNRALISLFDYLAGFVFEFRLLFRWWTESRRVEVVGLTDAIGWDMFVCLDNKQVDGSYRGVRR